MANLEEVINYQDTMMNYQDKSEMALKAIQELLKLVTGEDLIVVQQSNFKLTISISNNNKYKSKESGSPIDSPDLLKIVVEYSKIF